MIKRLFGTSALLAALVLVGCESAPKTTAQRNALEQQSQAALNNMEAKDPTLRNALSDAAGYAVFPDVGKGGAIIGGAFGRGILYQNGQATGYTELNQGSIGAQLGGQSFTELVVFHSQDALSRFKGGNFNFGAGASAVALKSGAAANTHFQNGVAVFVGGQSGLMAGAVVSGQQFTFQPLNAGYVNNNANANSMNNASNNMNDNNRGYHYTTRTEANSD